MADTSFVCFGSLARGEWTSASDLDWILLVNGDEREQHSTALRTLNGQLMERNAIAPAVGGMFARVVYGHQLIADISGGRSIRNLSLRLLLLLESIAIGDDGPIKKIIRDILTAYLNQDSIWHKNPCATIPEQLRRDIAAFGRAMAVDLDNQFDDQLGQKWGLRNAKRRFSRTLIIGTGLLVCQNWLQYCAERSPLGDEAISACAVEYFENYLARPPLEILADEILKHNIAPPIARGLFSAYDRFLSTLDNPASREELEVLDPELANTSALFQEMCDIGGEFGDALRKCLILTRPAVCKPELCTRGH